MHTFTGIRDLRWHMPDKSGAVGTVDILGYGALNPMTPFEFLATDEVMQVSFYQPDPEKEPRRFEIRELLAAFDAGEFGAVAAYVAPPTTPSVPIQIPAETLYFERMTNAEFDALDESVLAIEGRRVHRGFSVVATFTEGTDMWALLVKHLDLIGIAGDRLAELLARPTQAMASPDDEDATGA